MNRLKGTIALNGFAIVLAMLVMVVPAAVRAAAAPELTGVWQGKLAVNANTSMTVQFTFTKGSNGAYTAVLNSPDNPALKDAPVSGLAWDGASLKMQVPSVSGSFAGVLKDGKVSGQWTQPGGALPLVLSQYQKPVLTAATLKTLTGSWTGTLTTGGSTENLVFRFKPAAGGGIEGTFSIPVAGLTLPLSNVVFENGELSLKVPQAQLDYKGKLAGEQITGRITSPANPYLQPDGAPVNLKRGDYKPVAGPLKLSAAAFAVLKGKWQGQLELTNPQSGQKAQIPVILRFENNTKGEYVGFMDSPAQGANGLIMSEATLVDGKLALKVASIGGEFSGTVAGKTLSGEWAQPAAGFKQQLTLTQ